MGFLPEICFSAPLAGMYYFGLFDTPVSGGPVGRSIVDTSPDAPYSSTNLFGFLFWNGDSALFSEPR
jgi:hypothetical protein